MATMSAWYPSFIVLAVFAVSGALATWVGVKIGQWDRKRMERR